MLIKRIILATLALGILLTAGCGFRIQGSYSIPEQLRTLSLSSSDEYSELTRLVKERLRLNSIAMVEANKNIPNLRIVNDKLTRSTLSIYPTGNVAEYELMYRVSFVVLLPKADPQSFEVSVQRDYTDDPRTALAKSREMALLLKEMRIQAANQILQTLATVK